MTACTYWLNKAVEETRKFPDLCRCIWAGRVVDVMGARFDYPVSAFKKYGGLKPGAKKEWLYKVLGTNREVREKNMILAPNQNSRNMANQ